MSHRGGRRRVIDQWELGKFFGVGAIRGLVDGRRICARLLWWSHGHFGITRESEGTEEVLKQGLPGPDPYE